MEIQGKNITNSDGEILLNRHDRNYSRENYWANVYHDSIRGQESLQNLPLNIGRYAGSYVMFYLLSRIMKDYRPERILELGLGETTKFISTYLQRINHKLSRNSKNSKESHVIIEHEDGFRKNFLSTFELNRLHNYSAIDHIPMVKKQILTKTTKEKISTLGYDNLI